MYYVLISTHIFSDWLKNSPTVESFKRNLKRTSSVNGS